MDESGRKIFVSYKYIDADVQSLPSVVEPTWPCDYVDYIKNNLLKENDIYKGENSDEDISLWEEEEIWEHLKDKIYDSIQKVGTVMPEDFTDEEFVNTFVRLYPDLWDDLNKQYQYWHKKNNTLIKYGKRGIAIINIK